MAIAGRCCRGRRRVVGVCLSALTLAAAGGLGACTDPPGEMEPVVSYTPTCTGAGEAGCLSGTEVQALETFGGKLYAGLSNWEETLTSIWPATSAQINVLGARDGTWRRTPDLPGSPKCAPGNAPWEQVDDLHAATFAWQGTTAEHLFVGVLANESGACPGLHATVFRLDAARQEWVDTGLAARLEALYGAVNSEVRYVDTFSDGTADCPADRPCVFAFVGPRSGTVEPSVWRGVFDPGAAGCDLICWDAEPEVVMDGIQAPSAIRIVSSTSGPARLSFGTLATSGRRCRGLDESMCNRAALMQRVAPGAWEPAWIGDPIDEGGPDQVRGIASWDHDDRSGSLWFVTGPVGAVYRIDTTAGTASAPVVETTLGDLLPDACNARMLPYQLYVHQRRPTDANPELLVAFEACGTTQRDSFARIFHRPVAPGGTWGALDMSSVTNVGADRSNEAAVRWIETSPFDGKDLYFGTTDMNSTPGSLTARIYQLTAPFGC